MRNLKFRVWDKRLNKFYTNQEFFIGLDGDLNVYEDGEPEFITIQGCYNPNEQYYSIQQFTGLSDKNNREIYEGDIIRHYNTPFGIDRVSEVKFVGGSFILENEVSMIWELQKDLEIVGNIFENPELLEQ